MHVHTHDDDNNCKTDGDEWMSGAIILLGGGAVHWTSKKQSQVPGIVVVVHGITVCSHLDLS